MGLNVSCQCGNAVGMNQFNTMIGGTCAYCRSVQAQAARSAQGFALPTEKEVFGETIREQLAIESDEAGEQ